MGFQILQGREKLSLFKVVNQTWPWIDHENSRKNSFSETVNDQSRATIIFQITALFSL